MLAALRLFQARRIWLGAVLAALTLGFSPLAFLFLCLILLAVAIAHRRVDSRAIVTAVPPARDRVDRGRGAGAVPEQGRLPVQRVRHALRGGALHRRGAARAPRQERPGARGLLRPLGTGESRLLPLRDPGRRQHHAPARVRAARDAAHRDPRPLPAQAARRDRAGRGARLQPRADADAGAVPPRREARHGGLLAAGGHLPRALLWPELPRRGRADCRPLGGVLDSPGRPPTRPRLVPAARDRRLSDAVPREADPDRLPRVARRDGRQVRAAPGDEARPPGQPRRGATPAIGRLGAHAGLHEPDRHDLRGLSPVPAAHRPGAVVDHVHGPRVRRRLGRAGGAVHTARPVQRLLAGQACGCVHPENAQRHDQPRARPAGRLEAQLPGRPGRGARLARRSGADLLAGGL